MIQRNRMLETFIVACFMIFVPALQADERPSTGEVCSEPAGICSETAELELGPSDPPERIFGVCDEDCDDDRDACVAANEATFQSCVNGCGSDPFNFCFNACHDARFASDLVCTTIWIGCRIIGSSDCDSSPILLDLDQNNFQLAGLDDSVLFDIDADGHIENLSWTRWDQRDAFLCLDRNGNGLIDDGSELFGNYTPLMSGGRAANGYIALAEFDTPELGGVPDGYIDDSDAIYYELCVWTDSNHNAYSEPREMSGLAKAGVERIGLPYQLQRHIDEHGNQYRYVGDAWIKRGQPSRHTDTVDVFFVVDSD